MIPISDTQVRQKIVGWQTELREMTGDKTVRLLATQRPEIYLLIEDIAFIVAEETGVKLTLIRSKIRRRNIVTARHLICYYARNNSRATLTEIGKYLGGRDHTTVIHGDTSIRDLITSGNDEIVDTVARINKAITAIQEATEIV